MNDDITAPVRGRPFAPGQSGNPGGRVRGSRNKATLAAAALLAGEAERLTRKAVEIALAGDPLALRLCLERLLPRCRERSVTLSLRPIGPVRAGETGVPSPSEVCRTMNAVTSAVARGEITPGEAATIAGVFDTFLRGIETAGKDEFRRPSLRHIWAADDDDYDEDGSEDDADGDDGEENGDCEGVDDRDWPPTQRTDGAGADGADGGAPGAIQPKRDFPL